MIDWKRVCLIVVGSQIVLSAAVCAQSNPDGSVTLTPSKLYELVQETRDQVANIVRMNNRKEEVQDKKVTHLINTVKLMQENNAHKAVVIHDLIARTYELERKVAGVQKQVTVLHAKKADK